MKMDFSKKEPEFKSFQTNTGFECEKKLSRTKKDNLTEEKHFFLQETHISDN